MLRKLGNAGRVLMVVAMVMTLGCAKSDPPANIAKEIADKFYLALQQNDMEKALTYCSPKVSADQWRLHLDQVRKDLGDVVKVKFKRQEVNTTLRGRFFIFDYQVDYSGGKSASEILTLFHKVDEDGTYVVSYTISAENYHRTL